jgi:hypothetical protein
MANIISELLVSIGLESTIAKDGKATEGEVSSVSAAFLKHSKAIGGIVVVRLF